VTSRLPPAYPVRVITAITAITSNVARSSNGLSRCRRGYGVRQKKAARMSGLKSREETPKKGSSHEANLESAQRI
jgi:hypothetical protein